MEKRTSRKPIIVVTTLVLMCVCALLLCGALKIKKDINDTERAASYRISHKESSSQSEELLKSVLKDRLNIKLYDARKGSNLFLHFYAEGEADAINLSHISDEGFVISRWGNGIYIYAKSDKGFNRGAYYLSYNLIDENGRLKLKQDQMVTDTGKDVFKAAYVNGVSLSEFAISCDKESYDEATKLMYYINQSTGESIGTAKEGAADKVISLSIKEMDEPYLVEVNGTSISILGKDKASLLDAIDVFANTYLGWQFAGTDRARVCVRNSVLNIGDVKRNQAEWIKEREPIVTLWNVNSSRGVFLNSSTSLKVDVLSYSDEQLYDYVRMMKYCGFTGIQVTDMCSAWAYKGGSEFVHERLRFMADAAHSLGMKFTLWVWGSEFTGYGYADNTVTYAREGYEYAYENPKVVATFEKYYSIYAELADVCDRVIAHYYDPGNLTLAEDVGHFAKVLRDKFVAINPSIEFCVDCWVDVFDKSKLVAELGNNVTFLENGYHTDESAYNDFRSFCARNGVKLGTWSWNNAEMEIDQLAAMNYKPQFIKNAYQISIKYDEILKPSYWSEMDSYHVLNVFSLYACGNLLINPDEDVDKLTHDIAVATVGSKYADRFADMLRLIEEARSGDCYETFWWSEDGYVLKSDLYDAKGIKARSEQAMELLNELISEDVEAYTLPLPMSLNEMCRLILPSIDEIHSFAEFRIEYDELRKNAASLDKEELEERIKKLNVPVSEYNTVVGLWGQIEARAQYEMLMELAGIYNVNFEYDPTFKMERKYRIYSYFITYQKGHREPVAQYYPYFQYGLAYGYNETALLVQELIDEGILEYSDDGGVILSDWKHYIYSFN